MADREQPAPWELETDPAKLQQRLKEIEQLRQELRDSRWPLCWRHGLAARLSNILNKR
jgi:hypothetical protein